MNRKITILTDYKGNFGSKWNASPYRSGMDKELLSKGFNIHSYDLEYKRFNEVDIVNDYRDRVVLYTSSEDIGYKYKSYIEDIVYSLELAGANVIPSYKFLRANNNKVFMEMLRKNIFSEDINCLMTRTYGVIENVDTKKLAFPIVLKKAEGAMSKGVLLARNEIDFVKKLKLIARSPYYIKDIKDFLRTKKHLNYTKESLYRNKFIVQQFIPNLKSDFKVLVFGDRYYIFERPVRKNDFRASGSGNKNYIYGSKVTCPERIFDFAMKVFKQANVPHLSIDIAFDGRTFYLLEFQAIYFGTVGHVKSDGYYSNVDGIWKFQKQKVDIEKVFADSIILYLKRKHL